jgi:hypothetical protein
MSKNNNETVDFFTKHFNSVYSVSNINYKPELSQSLIHDLPRNCFFDISDVEKGLSRLKGNNSIGPYGISGDSYSRSDRLYVSLYGFYFENHLTQDPTLKYLNLVP